MYWKRPSEALTSLMCMTWKMRRMRRSGVGETSWWNELLLPLGIVGVGMVKWRMRYFHPLRVRRIRWRMKML